MPSRPTGSVAAGITRVAALLHSAMNPIAQILDPHPRRAPRRRAAHPLRRCDPRRAHADGTAVVLHKQRTTAASSYSQVDLPLSCPSPSRSLPSNPSLSQKTGLRVLLLVLDNCLTKWHYFIMHH